MYFFRPRFGMPRLWRFVTEVIVCMIVGSLALSACSSAGDSSADGDEPTQLADGAEDGGAASGQDPSDGATATSDEELTFGDPAEVGFDAVEDIEQDPVALPADASDDLSAPEDVIAEIAEELQSPAEGQEILDTIQVVDRGADTATDRDGRSRNSAGELAVLDEAANLACAHVEIALSQIDSGNDSVAIERIWSAADRAGSSTIATVQAWQEPLAAVIADGEVSDLAPLIGFITVCAEGGYEL